MVPEVPALSFASGRPPSVVEMNWDFRVGAPSPLLSSPMIHWLPFPGGDGAFAFVGEITYRASKARVSHNDNLPLTLP